MRKPVQIALAAVAVLLLGTTAVFLVKYRQADAQYHTLKTEEEATRTRYGNAIDEIAMIQDSLNTIVMGDSAVPLLSSQLQAEQRLSQTGGDEAMARISVIRAGIERTKDRIQELDARLKASGVKTAGLQKMIANLRKTVSEKEEVVASLTGRVDSLQTEVTGLTATVEQNQGTITQQAQTIEDSRRELGTIYYVIGSKKELKDSGVVVAKGGVLGLGKTLKPTGQVNESMFTAIDTDQETVITIPAAKAQVVSAQSPTSYELMAVGDQLQLRIIDPKEFRKVKHVVIVTA